MNAQRIQLFSFCNVEKQCVSVEECAESSKNAEYNSELLFSGYGEYMDACFRRFAETAELVQADRQQLACVWQGSDATQLILLPCSVGRAPYPSGTADSSFDFLQRVKKAETPHYVVSPLVLSDWGKLLGRRGVASWNC